MTAITTTVSRYSEVTAQIKNEENQITQIRTEMQEKIGAIEERVSPLKEQQEVLAENLTTTAQTVRKALKSFLETRCPLVMEPQERVIQKEISAGFSTSSESDELCFGMRPIEEVREECDSRISVEEETEYSCRHLEIYQPKKYGYEDIEVGEIKGLVALFPSGGVSLFIPQKEDTAQQIAQRAKRWKKKRKGQVFGFTYSHRISDDDGAVFEERRLYITL